jgi:hypothetical protein
MTRVESVQSCLLFLLCKRSGKERKKENPPTQNLLSLYTVHLLPSNHLLYSNVQSEASLIILHATNNILTNIPTPHHLTLQHINPLPNYIKLFRHHYTIFSILLRISQCLHLSVTPNPPTPILSTRFLIPHNHL